MAGFSIGRGTLLYGMPSLLGGAGKARRLRIGRQCLLNVGCVIDLAEPVTIGDRVGVGPEALWPEMVAMVVYATVLLVVATSRFRKSLA